MMTKTVRRLVKTICTRVPIICTVTNLHSHRQYYSLPHFSKSPQHNLTFHNFVSFVNPKKMSTFKFADYDCIGFDLDNTLLTYNVTNMAYLEYQVLAKFMVEKRNYDSKHLYKPVNDEAVDFIQKGLILDFDRGNVLKISSDGVIRRASHGTKLLTDARITEIYPNRRWEVTDDFVKNIWESWNGPNSLKMRCFLDYFDMPASLAFARAVDTIDEKSGTPEIYRVWPDVLDGLIEMFDGTTFRTGENQYFEALKKNPEKYLRKCSPETIDWIRELKRTKNTCLITGSLADFANFTSTYALGKDWRSLFDIVICYAKKPGFFIADRPFVRMSGYDEDGNISGAELQQGEIYSQGNWRDLKNFFVKISKNDSPRVLYVGDNLIQDIFVPSAHAEWDTVVVNEEMQSEGMIDYVLSHPDAKFLNSEYWGSYFCVKDSAGCYESLARHVIEHYSKICVPSMEVVAKKSVDEAYECFDKNDKKRNGYYPAKPKSLAN